MSPFFESLLARVLFALPRERVARVLGQATSARAPRPVLRSVIAGYVRAFNVDMNEAEVPPGGFDSFDAFFARRLRAGARPVDTSQPVLVSPSDGSLVDSGRIDEDLALTIKGQAYRVHELLDAHEDDDAFRGGAFAVVYLSPRDYHRVHSPCDAVAERVRHVPGTLFPVNAFGLRHVPKLFVRNERVVVALRSPVFGRVMVILVGAGIVGRIDLAIPAPPRPPFEGVPAERRFPRNAPSLCKGDDLGAFVLGSTVVVLVERPSHSPPATLQLGATINGAIRAGRPLFLLTTTPS